MSSYLRCVGWLKGVMLTESISVNVGFSFGGDTPTCMR